jgi:hypothetical protein
MSYLKLIVQLYIIWWKLITVWCIIFQSCLYYTWNRNLNYIGSSVSQRKYFTVDTTLNGTHYSDSKSLGKVSKLIIKKCSCHNIAEILLKLTLNTNQSTKSLEICFFLCYLHRKHYLGYQSWHSWHAIFLCIVRGYMYVSCI